MYIFSIWKFYTYLLKFYNLIISLSWMNIYFFKKYLKYIYLNLKIGIIYFMILFIYKKLYIWNFIFLKVQYTVKKCNLKLKQIYISK